MKEDIKKKTEIYKMKFAPVHMKVKTTPHAIDFREKHIIQSSVIS